jgi:hypothetical protein
MTGASEAAATKMTLTSAGNLGIEVTAPTENLTVHGAIRSTNPSADFSAGVAGMMIDMASGIGRIGTVSGTSALTGDVQFIANNAEKMRIKADGKVGIGTTAPNYLLNVGPSGATSLAGAGITLFAGGSLTSSIGGVLNFRPALGLTASEIHNLSIYAYDHSGDTNADGLSINAYDGISFCTGANSRQERGRIDGSGNAGIGTTSPSTYANGLAPVLVVGTGNNFATIQGRTDGPSGQANGVSFGGSYGTKPINFARIRMNAQGSAGQIGLLAFETKALENDTSQPIVRMTVATDGTVNVVGTFTAGTKTFRIDHPLPAKNDTHYLLHSSIEGPQADLIYRGRADLVSGTVDVNIDTAAGMTEGTFEVLCTDVQCFTSNEDGWTALKGAVTGNVLTITAQDDTCTDTVSWMVIGERKDAKMIESEWADNDGKLIVETLKSEHEYILEG